MAGSWAFWPAIVDAGAWVLAGTRWSERDEQTYEQFVKSLGESGYGNLNRFIRDPKVNPLYSDEDKKLSLSPDCADLPYLLRAYVAYKLRLPFSYTSAITGKGGGDERYRNGNRPTRFKTHSDFVSAQQLFNQVVLINSGYYRMSPEIEDSDTYPVRISKYSIKPGTIYYDPNGHVALVYQVTPDGRIRLIDAHPDKSISRPWFGSKFALGSRKQGGGFRQWRPVAVTADGSVVRQINHNLVEYSDSDQYQSMYAFPGTNGLSYFDYVRAKLSGSGGRINPTEEFRLMMADLYEDVRYRALAVDICLKAGIHRKEHPGFLPWNIYGTDGEWENYSTPSRDARLKVGFAELFRKTVEMVQMAEQSDPRLTYSGGARQLAAELAAIYDAYSPQYAISYQNSAGREVRLSFNQVVKRLFLMSFDPYHSVELRWGATGDELRSAADTPLKMKFYRDEMRLRHQLERLYNCQTGLDLGPATPPDVDIRSWLARYLQGQGSTMVLAQLPTALPTAPMPAPLAAPAEQSRPAADATPPIPPLLPEKRSEPRLVFAAPAVVPQAQSATELPQPVVAATVRAETSLVPVTNSSARPKKAAQVATTREYYQFADRVMTGVDEVLAGMFRSSNGTMAKVTNANTEGDAEFSP